MGKSIGIDLGTTNTCAAVVDHGRPQVIRSEHGYMTIPSVVTFDDRGQAIVGQPAERRMGVEPEATVYGSKRLLGRAFLSGVCERFQPYFHYALVNHEGLVAAKIEDRVLPLTEVAALILREVRRSAERSLKDRVDRAVVTVPAYFNERQRQCVREAGEIAELEVIRTINEPTAAALAFGTRQRDTKRVLVFDLGGGTFDVSLVDIDGDVYEVLGVEGDTFLGGIDFDRALADFLLAKASEKEGRELLLPRLSEERLRSAVQNAKHELSVQPHFTVQLRQLELETGDHIDISQPLTRNDVVEATRPLVDRTLETVQRCLDAVDLQPSDVDDVLLVGGQTRMPAIHERLEAMFGRAPSKRVHPDEVVAVGAAIAAHSVGDAKGPSLRDVVPMAIGLQKPGDVFDVVIARNTPVPHTAKKTFTVPAGARQRRLLVFQGNSTTASENSFLGTISIDQLPNSASDHFGTLTFQVSDGGVLSLTAVVPSLNVEQEITLASDVPADLGDDDARIDQIKVVESRPTRGGHVSRGGTAAQPSSWFGRVLAALGLGR